MVIAQLQGGLGNQLFQYAAGRRLAYRRRTELKLDIFGYHGNPLRQYRLARFPIAASVATKPDLGRFIGRRPRGIWRRVHDRVVPHHRRRLWDESHFHFDPAVLEAGGETYLRGYWQSERYFADVADLVRRELTPPAPTDPRSVEIAAQIRSRTAVALHVRRGDYVSDPSAAVIHGTCPPSYYAAAVAHVRRHVSDAHLFVFSDDPEWPRAHLRLGAATTFVAHGGADTDIRDLWLMSSCRHHIIANSTFAWWAAWLGGHPEQIVVAPSRWFAGAPFDTRDLLPARWLRL